LVDSNILIYLLDSSDAQKHNLAITWLESCFDKMIFVSVQNLREFASNCLNKGAPAEKVLEFLDLFTAKFVVLQDDQLDTKIAIELCKGNPKLFWDANIVSVMHRNGIEYIYTENVKDFSTLKIRAINPLK
jgi:predicted nucleic acid-binding protein